MAADPPPRGAKRANPGRISVREMELDDLPAVYALGETLFTSERWPSLYRTWDEYDLVGLFASDGEFCLIAERDEAIVGFALGYLIEKRKSAWKYGYVDWLGVSRAVQGRGVGRRLMNRLTELFEAAGARMMLVDTDARNEPAIRFFRSAGFSKSSPHIYLSKKIESDDG